MFGIGLTELLLVFMIALLFIGPKRLPGFARGVGRMVGQLTGVSRQFYGALTDAAKEQDGDGSSRPPGWFSDVARPGSSIKVRERPDDENAED